MEFWGDDEIKLYPNIHETLLNEIYNSIKGFLAFCSSPGARSCAITSKQLKGKNETEKQVWSAT